ncbi:MAG TPA: hypothetical protein VIX63_04880, partial [Vicinamibacterales bacterium]
EADHHRERAPFQESKHSGLAIKGPGARVVPASGFSLLCSCSCSTFGSRFNVHGSVRRSPFVVRVRGSERAEGARTEPRNPEHEQRSENSEA